MLFPRESFSAEALAAVGEGARFCLSGGFLWVREGRLLGILYARERGEREGRRMVVKWREWWEGWK